MHTIRQVLNFRPADVYGFKTLLYMLLLTTACSNDDDPSSNNGIPIITSLSPTEGQPGETISVKGNNFATFAQDNQFFFNGIRAQVHVGIPEELLVRVPLEASTGPVSLLVPGFDTIRGPIFTVERIASATRTSLYYTGGTDINRATFDEEGNVSIERIFFRDEMNFLLGALEIDIPGQKIYVINGEPGRPAIYRLNIDGTEFETLYNDTDPALVSPGSEPYVLRRITLDLQEENLYVTDASGRIIRGNLDGGQPLEILYDDGPGINTAPFGISLAVGNDYIYWCEFVNPRVIRMPRDGSASTREILYDDSHGLLEPREIVIDEPGDRIFISDDPSLQEGENVDRILIGNLDGTQELETLFEGDPDIVVNPEFGLALDAPNNLLYWAGRPFSGSSEFTVIRADLSREDTQPNVIADDNDIAGFRHFTVVVTEEGGSNGRLRARIGD